MITLWLDRISLRISLCILGSGKMVKDMERDWKSGLIVASMKDIDETTKPMDTAGCFTSTETP